MDQNARFSLVAMSQWYLEGSLNYGARGFQKGAASFAPDALSVDMSGRVTCVTGANSGIGFCVAKSLAERNATVHMICRNEVRGKEARRRILEETGNDHVYLHMLDVSDFRKVEAFAAEFLAENPLVNVLINNAGGMPGTRTLSAQDNECIMTIRLNAGKPHSGDRFRATMAGGAFLLTKLLLPSLERAAAADTRVGNRGGGGARVINVSSAGMYTVSASGVGRDLNSVGVEPYDGALIYALAKRVQVILTERWAAIQPTAGKRIRFDSMHPGWSDTPGLQIGMPGFRERQQNSLRTSEQGADTIVWLACSEAAAAEQTGKFWFDRKARRTHMPLAGTNLSESERVALWEAVEKYCSAAA